MAKDIITGYCYRWCKTHKNRLPPNLYFQKLCASTLQINIVNTSVPDFDKLIEVYNASAKDINATFNQLILRA